ncbi:biotin/lipoyl-containing protein [Corynebacterium pyruviciproducens]|uniref:biotin/lipoyl-containing protein n=1 Tax=Corynebacterium pyruviciproducens TaxID=598660 RepID=UPI00254EFF68|nr:biotin/lipoyl-containing protein [Corynebacterium pyruviciproducens]MDK7213496.1 biotin/lipoyl-containing protein [Corynebacterium pyruviciproducens]
MKLKVTVNGIAYDVDVEVEEERRTLGSINIGGSAPAASAAASSAATQGGSGNAITAPLAGSVFKILVAEGDEIKADQVVIVLEAMKMETEITAPADGKVGKIHVAQGDAVQGGQVLLDVE